ncbi:hypothetical protein BB561_001313 [Smittium simulii]|uniref:Uncharacterized protein n=1 Tax=Smittium simulii TaxID=133385 RepID=A0A2T9YV41_9FUNG|nr:hypothetical protein BB561_001313 [Smittium simulii]
MSKTPSDSKEVKKEMVEDSANSLPTRLASIRATSSTTLGGVQKMRFAPKAPVRRVKQEPSADESSSNKKKGIIGLLNDKHNSRGDKNFNGGRNNPSNKKRDFKKNLFQQISGPFSMGPASIGQSRGSNRASAAKTSSENGGIVYSAQMKMLPSAFNEFSGSNAKQEEMDDILFNSDDEEFDMTEEEKSKSAPVVLLTDQNADTTLFGDASSRNAVISANNIPENEIDNIAHLFESNTDFNNLMILQLPQVMPKINHSIKSEGASASGTTSTTSDQTSLSTSTTEDIKPDIAKLESQPSSDKSTSSTTPNTQPPKDEDLVDFDANSNIEGQIAELVVHKSGKAFLHFGDIKMNLLNGISCQFAQQLVALDVDAKQFFSFGELEWDLSVGKGVQAFVYWKKPSEWANYIYSWVIDQGLANTVLTVFELTNPDPETNNLVIDQSCDLFRINQEVLLKALKILKNQGKVTLFTGTDTSSLGIKFHQT